MTHLQRLLISDGAFVTPAHALANLSANEIKARPCGAPHSIYEELWHMRFWQRLILSVIRGEPVTYTGRVAEGWPEDNEALTEEAWGDLVAEFLTDLEEAAALAGSPRLTEVVKEKTVREHLESIAGHNAYHVGQVVFLRQLQGLWPPPSGGDTW